MRLNEFYQEEPGGTFTHDGNEYMLNPLLRFADKIKVQDLPMSELEWIVDIDKNPHDKDYDMRVRNADIGIPLLVTKWNDKYVVLDGFHRLVKAIKLNKKNIPVKMVSDRLLSYFEI